MMMMILNVFVNVLARNLEFKIPKRKQENIASFFFAKLLSRKVGITLLYIPFQIKVKGKKVKLL